MNLCNGQDLNRNKKKKRKGFSRDFTWSNLEVASIYISYELSVHPCVTALKRQSRWTDWLHNQHGDWSGCWSMRGVALHVYCIHFSQYTHPMGSGRSPWAAGEYLNDTWVSIWNKIFQVNLLLCTNTWPLTEFFFSGYPGQGLRNSDLGTTSKFQGNSLSSPSVCDLALFNLFISSVFNVVNTGDTIQVIFQRWRT